LLDEVRSLLVDTAGEILISVPNVAHWRTRLSLLLGRWDYVDRGTLDSTHLRFFTRSTICQLLQRAEYKLQSVAVVADRFPLDRFTESRDGVYRWKQTLNRAALRRMPGLFGYQVIVVANVGVPNPPE
jgi:hypothetical protein